MNSSGEVRIYSRNSEDNTTKYPDIIARVPELLNEGIESFIIDCEAVAYDLEKVSVFDLTMSRPCSIVCVAERKRWLEAGHCCSHML